MPRITPTCVPHSFEEIEQTLERVGGFARALHLDINDGIFASPRTWPYTDTGVGEVYLPESDLSITAHLMVEEPRVIGEALARAGVYGIIAHSESFATPEAWHDATQVWRAGGVQQIGIALRCETSTSHLAAYASEADFIHVLSVATIGAQGAPFESTALQKITELHRIYRQLPIEVDGGVSAANIKLALRAGASRFAIGSAIMHVADSAHAYHALEAIINEN